MFVFAENCLILSLIVTSKPENLLERPTHPHGLPDHRHLGAGAVSHAVGATASTPVSLSSTKVSPRQSLILSRLIEILVHLILVG